MQWGKPPWRDRQPRDTPTAYNVRTHQKSYAAATALATVCLFQDKKGKKSMSAAKLCIMQPNCQNFRIVVPILIFFFVLRETCSVL
jgi:hypothetical protein